MLTPQLMAAMDDSHLLAAIDAEFDPLTRTPLEDELIKRLQVLLTESAESNPIAEIVEEYDLDTEELKTLIESHPSSLTDMAQLLQVLCDDDINTPDQLRAKLERSDSFFDIATDAGDAFSRLADLAKTTL